MPPRKNFEFVKRDGKFYHKRSAVEVEVEVPEKRLRRRLDEMTSEIVRMDELIGSLQSERSILVAAKTELAALLGG